MKYRSLKRIFILSILTLGIYELFWIAQTRQEIVKKYRTKVPRVKVLLFLYILQLLVLGIFCLIALQVIPKYQSQIDNIKQPDSGCMLSYAKDKDLVEVASRECKGSVDNFYAQQNRADRPMTIAVYSLIASLVVYIISPVFFARWFSLYALGVSRATSGRISRNKAMFALYSPMGLGIIYIQNAFNKYT